MTLREVQAALLSLGHDPGPLDGVNGARTRAAVRAFQAAKGLVPDGVIGPRTIGALQASVAERSDRAPVQTAPPWYVELLRRKGLHETRDRPSLMAWLRSDGKTLGDPAKLPWCGDAIATCLALTIPDEPQPANPYLARNWMKFGRPLAAPSLGAVLVFWRGSKGGTAGHVGLYVGEDDNALHVLGGNQSNAITIARLDRGRLLGARWPNTYPLPTTGRVRLTSAGAPLSRNEA